jgi:cell division septation protein DedD
MSQPGGEKELILGNKQLISLFFIVVALCAVFFAMGYIVRGNSLKGSVPTVAENVAPASDGVVKRQQPDPPRETASDAPSAEPPHIETHPADDAPQPSGASVEPRPTQKLDSPKPEAYKSEAYKPEPAKSDSVKTDATEPGTYIQVGALPLADAETTARTLKAQHLPASIAPSSKDNLFRVMVGPYHQTSEVADAKTQLKKLGFSDTVVKKQ